VPFTLNGNCVVFTGAAKVVRAKILKKSKPNASANTFFMTPPILVQPVVIVSETLVGLCVHNVANHFLSLVTKTVTKSETTLVHKNKRWHKAFLGIGHSEEYCRGRPVGHAAVYELIN
jgi:hypothetical protein